jgi:PqqD family protein of HPr-rel-A system
MVWKAHELDLRAWGDEWVVHVGPSNDTHRLSPEAGRVLQIVVARPRRTSAEVAADVDDAPEHVEALLHALARAGIVGEC